jgi:hypothetical protein
LSTKVDHMLDDFEIDSKTKHEFSDFNVEKYTKSPYTTHYFTYFRLSFWKSKIVTEIFIVGSYNGEYFQWLIVMFLEKV